MNGSKNKNGGNSYFFDSKLSDSFMENLVRDFLAYFSKNPSYYLGIVFRNASRFELLYLADFFGERFAKISRGDKITLGEKTFEIGNLVDYDPCFIYEIDNGNSKSFQRSINLLRLVNKNLFYVILDEKSKLDDITDFGFYVVDVGYYLKNYSS